MTIFTICYNEELMLPYFIKHYRDRFPDCRIVIYDNYSTDASEAIALSHGCEVIKYDTGGKLSDSKYLEIKNNCWKGTKGYVIVCDVDELLFVTPEDLTEDIIQGEGYNMLSETEITDWTQISQIKLGYRAEQYDKLVCFNASKVREISYAAGCHAASPVLEKFILKQPFPKRKLLHYKGLGEDYVVNRYKLFASRLSDENKKYKWGFHYLYEEERIRQDYKNGLLLATNVL